MEREIINGHIHFDDITKIEEVKKIYLECGIKKVNIVNIPTVNEVNKKNFASICFKYKYPEDTYICAGLEYFLNKSKDELRKDFLEQVKKFMEMGFDGVKILETKPIFWKWLPFAIDDEIYEDYFLYLEENKIPIVWHAADPARNWDENRIHPVAKKNNWGYFSGDYPTRERFYKMVENVLRKHPGLRIVFSHFFYLYDDLKRAEKIFETYKGVNFDITPGAEMYVVFSKNHKETREFFIEYQDRIILGEDGPMGEFSKKVINFIRKFLETEDKFPMIESYGYFLSYEGEEMYGLGLPEEVLNKIYHQNFITIFGEHPKKLNFSLIIEEIGKKQGIEDIKNFIRGINGE